MMLAKASHQFSKWKGVCSYFKVYGDNSHGHLSVALHRTEYFCRCSKTEAKKGELSVLNSVVSPGQNPEGGPPACFTWFSVMTSCVSRASPSQCLTSVYYPIRCSPEGCRGRVWRGEGKRKMGKWPCLNKQKKTFVQHEFTNEKSLFQIKNGRPGGEEEPGPVWTVQYLASTWAVCSRQPESPVAPRSHPRPLHMRCLLIGLLQEWECNACIRSGRSHLGTSALGKAAFMD